MEVDVVRFWAPTILIDDSEVLQHYQDEIILQTDYHEVQQEHELTDLTPLLEEIIQELRDRQEVEPYEVPLLHLGQILE